VVAEPKPFEELGLATVMAGCGGRPPLAPYMDAVISHEVDQDDGQVGGEGAAALPIPEDAVVIFEEPEQRPGAEFVYLVLR
jgi:hypothetical protein